MEFCLPIDKDVPVTKGVEIKTIEFKKVFFFVLLFLLYCYCFMYSIQTKSTTVKGNYSLLEDAYDDLEEAGFFFILLTLFYDLIWDLLVQRKIQCQRLKYTPKDRKIQRKLVKIERERKKCLFENNCFCLDDYETTLMIPTK